MRYTTAKTGRVFVLRLEDGEILHHEVEKFALANNINSAIVKILGGADKGSILVVGPADGRAKKIEPMEYILDNVYEITGVGTIFPNSEGSPIVHLHASCGRNDKSITGCVRKGVKVWVVMEVIITELIDCKAKRMLEKENGFELLNP